MHIYVGPVWRVPQYYGSASSAAKKPPNHRTDSSCLSLFSLDAAIFVFTFFLFFSCLFCPSKAGKLWVPRESISRTQEDTIEMFFDEGDCGDRCN